MEKARLRLVLYCLVFGGALFALVAISPEEAASSSLSFDFEGSAAREWTTPETCAIEGNKVLGLFNDRNKKYLAETHLNLKGLPPQTPVAVSFDLYLVGTWDSAGQLGDRWTLSLEKGAVLLDLTKFPNAFSDKEEVNPIGNKGFVTVGTRKLAYWIVKETVVVPGEQILDGTISLRFQGFLTGRKTEFWGLDNVTVKVGN